MKESILRQSLRPGEKFRVNITHIENPQRFFAVKYVDLDELNHLENELNIEYAEDQQNQVIYFAKLHMSCALCVEEKWYRGFIEEINGNGPNDIRVRLIDHGRSVTVSWHQLHFLTERFIEWREMTFECYLADVEPLQGTNSEWTERTIADFVQMTSNSNIQMTISSASRFRHQVVLNVIKRHLRLNIGALLVKFKHALSTGDSSDIVSSGLSDLDELINIDEIEHDQQTLQSWYEKLKKTLKSLPFYTKDLEERELLDKSDTSIYEISDLVGDPDVITEWLPAEPMERTMFAGYPTSVDYDGIVYFHEADKHDLLNTMCNKMNEELDLDAVNNTDENWTPGQPCLARYHLDQRFYRAVIHRCLPNDKFEVLFIDYGNVESCEATDIYRIIAFPNIPVQVNRIYIDGIQPIYGEEKLSPSALDLVHGMIVDKMCVIMVAYGQENKDIKKCSIRLHGTDLATYLIKNRLVRVLDYESD